MQRVKATGGAKASSSDERSDLPAPKYKNSGGHRLNPEHWKTRECSPCFSAAWKGIANLSILTETRKCHLILEQT